MTHPPILILSPAALALLLCASCGSPAVTCPEGEPVDGRCIAADAGTDASSSEDGGVDASSSGDAGADASSSGDAGTDASSSGDAGAADTGAADTCAADERVCDGLDDDCDGVVDEGVQTTYYADMDMDGWGDAATSCAACDPSACPVGTWVDNDRDCDDGRSEVHPVADPSAPETRCNGLDDDCDGTVDEGVLSTFYRDADRDGFGDRTLTRQACSAPAGYVDNPDDCADSDDRAHPGQTQYFDSPRPDGSFDFNCNGRVERAYEDARGQHPVEEALPVGRCTVACPRAPLWVDTLPPCGTTASYWECTYPSGICMTALGPFVTDDVPVVCR